MKRLILIFAVLTCALALFAIPPLPPVLVSPSNGAVGLDPNDVTLVWNHPTSGGTPSFYRIYTYSDAYGQDPIYHEFDVYYPAHQLALSTQPGVQLGYGRYWSWGIKSYNSDGDSAWSESFFFTTMDQGALPTPQVTITTAGGLILLDWPDVPGANSYLVYGGDEAWGGLSLLGVRAVSNAAYASAARKFYRVVASSETPN